MKKQDFEIYANGIIRAYNDVKSVWAAVLEVSKQMDGKVINKRFTEAIDAKCVGVGSVWLDNSKLMHVQIYNRSIQTAHGPEYIDRRLYYCTSYGVAFSGRVDAAEVASMYSALVKNINDKINQWKDAAKNFDKYQEKTRKALQALNKAFEGINPIFKPSVLNSFDWERAENYFLSYNK